MGYDKFKIKQKKIIMKNTYNVTGMTCNGCVSSVTEKISKIDGVLSVQVDLENKEAVIDSNHQINLSNLQEALSPKYTISKKEVVKTESVNLENNSTESKSKIEQLKPLFLILFYLFASSILLNYKSWDIKEVMLDFMGLFYIVFSFFKFLDLKGFPESFRMYDPLAKIAPFYGWVYPFVETVLGLFFLMRFQIPFALILTIIILGITTIGVTRTLLDKKSIRCACLGTALKLPMTEATFIENAIMLVMAITMLIQTLL